MASMQEALAASGYALFALQQPLPLAEIAKGSERRTFPVAQTSSPDWFAAAAKDGSSLLDMAPELIVTPEDAEAIGVSDVSGIDLIHVYRPELAEAAFGPVLEPVDEPPAVAPKKPATEKPGTATQIGLLKELSNLDT